MNVRTTVDIPAPLHNTLRKEAQRSGTSMRLLILRALANSYSAPAKGKYVTGPMIRGRGKRGPRYPTDKTPHDLILP
jgi:hypothetical protein